MAIKELLDNSLGADEYNGVFIHFEKEIRRMMEDKTDELLRLRIELNRCENCTNLNYKGEIN